MPGALSVYHACFVGAKRRYGSVGQQPGCVIEPLQYPLPIDVGVVIEYDVTEAYAKHRRTAHVLDLRNPCKLVMRG